MSEVVEQPWIASFWRRIGALVLDSLLLALVGFLLSLVFGSLFAQIGDWARLVGFGIGLAYFGVMNSALCNGQTIGKQFLNLRVVDLTSQTIPLSRSVLRYLVLAVPFSLNGIHISDQDLFSYLIYPLSFIVVGGSFSIVYLYVFNRVTRQSLHDLAAGTVVVNSTVEKQTIGTLWKPHLVVVALFFVAALVVPALTEQLVQEEPYQDLLAAQSALSNEQGVIYATLQDSTTTSTANNEVTQPMTLVIAQVVLSSNNVSDVELARKMAADVVKHYPQALNADALRVTLTYGYDMGLWSQWSYQSHQFNPSEFAAPE